MWTSLGLNQGPPDYESVALQVRCIRLLDAVTKVVFSIEICKS